MSKNVVLSFVFVVMFVFQTFAMKQEVYKKHVVVKGDTVNLIAQKYNVTPYDIFRLNPDSQKGIKLDSVLLIPPSSVNSSSASTTSVASQNKVKYHVVQPKETLYSLSRLYNVLVDDIKNANVDLLKDGLKIGQNVKIPATSSVTYSQKTTEISNESNVVKPSVAPTLTTKKEVAKTIYHTVAPKETKFGIAKQYGITIEELEALNPETKQGLNIGVQLQIKSNNVASSVVESAKPVVKPESNAVSTKRYLQEYVVKPQETIYSISKEFSISEDELVSLNPELKKGVKIGMILRVPMKEKVSQKVNIVKSNTNLNQSIKTDRQKNLVLMLPFNLSKIESDTVNSTQARLKKDKFLNMTLDFYSGAFMAIDSAKTLGLNVNVSIFDSQETKNSSNVNALVQQNNLSNADAIIGPFYQNNVEKLSELLQGSQTAIISPLSKESGKGYSNLYQSMPSADDMRNAIFEFMRAKNGNIVAIVDSKKASVLQYLKEFHKDVKIVGLNDKGGFVSDSLYAKLDNSRINYVVLASERTGLILSTTSAMVNAQRNYQVQMVILEQNETLDFEEIPLNRLTKLNMMYPSLTRVNETPEALYFESNYKKINKILPNQYAVRGFDVTFDTLLRLSQDKSYQETIESSSSEHIESKFDYSSNADGSYTNKGIYILYYDNDLSIKQAN